MPWEDRLRTILDRAVRRLRMEKLSFPMNVGFLPNTAHSFPPRLAMRDVFQLEAVARSDRDTSICADPAASHFSDQIIWRARARPPRSYAAFAKPWSARPRSNPILISLLASARALRLEEIQKTLFWEGLAIACNTVRCFQKGLREFGFDKAYGCVEQWTRCLSNGAGPIVLRAKVVREGASRLHARRARMFQ